MLKTLPQRLIAMSMVSILLFLGVLGFGLSTFSQAMNARAMHDSLRLAESKLRTKENALIAVSYDYNNWDEGFDYIRNRDWQRFYANYAATVETQSTFTSLYLLDAFGAQSVRWTTETGNNPIIDDIDPDFLAMVRSVIATRLVFGAAEIPHFYTVEDGQIWGHAVSFVLPLTEELRAPVRQADAPISIMSREVDADYLASIETESLARDIVVSDAPMPGYSGFALRDGMDRTVAYINLLPPTPGTEIMQAMLPKLAVLAALFVTISVSIGVIARRNALDLMGKEKEAQRMARRDPLTGMANRMAFHERIEQLAAAPAHSVALIYLDINDFKKINDSFGHEAGDTVIMAVAGRLMQLSGNDTLVTRIGGDEFTILHHGALNATQAAHALLARLHLLLAAPIPFGSHAFDVQSAIGVALNDRSGPDTASLLHRADVAMYHAKRTGRKAPQFYAAELEQDAREDALIERALRSAIDTPDELQVLFQPIVCARTGTFIKGEALARWTSRSLGVVSPERFIRVAERSGLISDLGRLLFRRTCELMLDYPGLKVCVNVSPLQLQDEDYLFDVHAIVTDYGISPDRIDFELTEGTIVENRDLVSYRLKRMHEMGFKTSLDDFGTGFSSIGYLRDMPFDTLKIDRSFLLESSEDARSMDLVRSMILMGQSLGQTVVCEGVETRAHADLMASYGCDLLQGYYFDRARAIEDIARDYGLTQSTQVA